MQNIDSYQPPVFGKVRSFLWPIYGYELKKVIPMFLMFFLISFVYNLLRCLKISLIITASGAGAEVVPYLKIGAVLPGAIFFTYIFAKLNNRFNREKVFYSMLMVFLGYFSLFALVLYPLRETLELTYFANFLQQHVFTSEGLRGLVAIIRYWNLTVFYVFCEMWSAIVLTVLFWGFANEVTKVNEAKRFYAIFALGSNVSGIFTGFFAKIVNTLSMFTFPMYDKNTSWIFYQLFIVISFGAVIILLFYYLNKYVFFDSRESSIKVKKKHKISLMKSFSYLLSSKYLFCVVVIVVSYHIVYNFADVMWTHKVKQVFTNGLEINNYMVMVTLYTGIVAALSAFIISGNAVRYLGWTFAALITPVVWAATSLGFFGGLVFESSMIFDMFYAFIGNPANIVLLLGTLQICLGRGCKYTVFDETKELTFIPLSEENKRKGKAVVDGIASRFGKSGGSFVYVMLFMVMGDISHTIPYISAIIFVVITFWIIAILSLGKMVKRSIDEEAADLGKFVGRESS